VVILPSTDAPPAQHGAGSHAFFPETNGVIYIARMPMIGSGASDFSSGVNGRCRTSPRLKGDLDLTNPTAMHWQ